VFPARYELNSYIVFRIRLVSKILNSFGCPGSFVATSFRLVFCCYLAQASNLKMEVVRCSETSLNALPFTLFLIRFVAVNGCEV
jgi:hypothetical protein